MAIREITDRIGPSEAVFDMITLWADKSLPRVEKIGNVTVYRVGPSKRGITHEELTSFPWYMLKVWYLFAAPIKALSLIKKNNYSVMWSLMTYMSIPAVFVRAFGKKIPFVLTLQDGDTIEHIVKRGRVQLFLPLIKKGFKDAQTVQVISNYLGEFAKEMGCKKDPVVVPNGVSIDKFEKVSKNDVENIKKDLGKKEGDVFLVTTSRLVEKNDLESVIRALPKLSQCKFIVLGDGHLKKHLQSVAEDLQVSNQVKFLGHVEYENIPTYLHASDIFIRPSLSEGLGSSFLEAMAAGLPVVATRIGGIPDFLLDVEEHGDKATGIFCEVNSPESIVFAVTRLIQDTGLREKISQNGQKLVKEKYDWDDITKRMKKILNI